MVRSVVLNGILNFPIPVLFVACEKKVHEGSIHGESKPVAQQRIFRRSEDPFWGWHLNNALHVRSVHRL
jgi:hypothetical protein